MIFVFKTYELEEYSRTYKVKADTEEQARDILYDGHGYIIVDETIEDHLFSEMELYQVIEEVRREDWIW